MMKSYTSEAHNIRNNGVSKNFLNLFLAKSAKPGYNVDNIITTLLTNVPSNISLPLQTCD